MDRGPQELMLAVLDRIAKGNYLALADLYAEDVVVEHPQQHPEPGHTRGLETQREHWAYAEKAGLNLAPEDVVVHQTLDPHVVVAEFFYAGRVERTGRSYRYPQISVLRAADGHIVHARDCQDDLALAVARDRFDRMAEAITRVGAASVPPPAAGGSEHTAAGAVMRRLIELLVRSDHRAIEPLLAPDAVLTPMFLPGREPLRGWPQIGPELADRRAGALTYLAIHEGADGQTVIGDFGYSGSTGDQVPFHYAEMVVAKIVDGLVAELRDYQDVLRVSLTDGRLMDLAGATAR